MKRDPKGAPRRPLTAVVARSAEGNRELTARLGRMGIRAVPVRTVDFLEPSDWSEVDGALRRLGGFDWVVLTSARGAEAFESRMRKLGLERDGCLPKVAAVGEVTAARLEKEGFHVDFVPSEYLTEAVGEELPFHGANRVLLLRAEGASEGMGRALRKRGFAVTSVPVYRTRFFRTHVRAGDLGGADVVVLGSPSEVSGLVGRLPPAALRSLRAKAVAACIGPVTARAAREAGFKRVLSPRLHTFDALLMEVRRTLRP